MRTGAKGDRWSSRGKPALGLALLVCLPLGLCGCSAFSEWVHNGFKVGPNYSQPVAQVGEEWIDAANPKVRSGNPDIATWWEVFDDPVLTELIHAASTQNLTMRQAGLQMLRAGIQRNIALSELLPQGQSLVAGYGHGVVSRNYGLAPGGGPAFSTALAPSVTLSPPPTPTTPIAGATSTGNAGTTIAGTTTTSTTYLLNPSLGAGGAGAGLPVGTSRIFDNFGTSLNLAWELDFWGLFRRNLEAAEADLDQSMQNYDAIMVQLLANVATQYVELRTLQRRLELARQNVQFQEPLVAKLKEQSEAGFATSKPAYFQLKSNLDNTRALIPPLEISLRQANNQLCVLLGMPVRDLLPELGESVMADPKDQRKQIVRIPRPKDDSVVLGIPGDLLLRRPDVLAMERQLRIQSAQIGIAEAEMLPHIGINGSIGLAANGLGRMFNQQSWIGGIGPSLTWNILNYGRLLANVRSQNNLYQQFVLAYQQAVLNANQDAENALVAYLRSLEQATHLHDSANAAVEVTTYYYTQLAEGYLQPATTSLSLYNLLFTSVNFRVQQQDAAAQADGNVALNLILLYRALGGGWQIRLKDALRQDTPDLPPSALASESVPMLRATPRPGLVTAPTPGAPAAREVAP